VSTRIILVDDHKIIREGLRALIERQPGMQIVGEAENGRDATEMTKKLRPHAIVMDVSMPDMNGIEATRRILDESPGVKILALSMHGDRKFVMEMLKAGASGYLLKETSFEELTHAIRVILSGCTYLSYRISDVMIKNYIQTTDEKISAVSTLTGREREVLQLIAEGITTKDIAARLSVSVKTVETHRQHIVEKLKVRSVAELTKLAIREGLTSLEN
jgi:DNA-binding NarL/FixJ family response regulator